MSFLDDILKRKDDELSAQATQAIDIRGRSRLNPNGDANAPANGGELSLGAATPTPPTIVVEQPIMEEQPKRRGYVELFQELNELPSKEELEKEKKRHKQRAVIAAIGDGLSALANMYYVNKGAQSMYDGKNTLSDREKARYDKFLKGYEKNKAAYYKNHENAQRLDDEWNRYNEERKERKERTRLAAEQKAQAAVQAQLNKDREYTLGVAKAAETARHNAAMETRNTGGSAKTSFSPYILVDGEKVEFSPNEYGTAAIDAAYEEMLSLPGGEEYAVKVKNPGYGQSDIDPYPSQYKKRAAIEKWNKAQRGVARGEVDIVDIPKDDANAKLLGMEPGKIYEHDGKYYRLSAEGKKLGLTKEKKVGLQ